MTAEGDGPRDARSRKVTEITEAGHGAVTIQLECGHVIRRRPMCNPSRAICPEC